MSNPFDRNFQRHCRKNRKRLLLSAMAIAAALAVAVTTGGRQHCFAAAAFQMFRGRGGLRRGLPAAATAFDGRFATGTAAAAFLGGGVGPSRRPATPSTAAAAVRRSSRLLSNTASDSDCQRKNQTTDASAAAGAPPQRTYVNDTIKINTVGTALPTSDVAAAAAAESASSVLAIDPSTIEIVPCACSVPTTVRRATAEASREELHVRIQPDNSTEALKYSNGEKAVLVVNGETAVKRENQAATKAASATPTAFQFPGQFDFVKMFRGSAPYIANHRNTLAVYHIPGELLEWDGFSDLMNDITLTWLLGMKIVLVCGCRHQIDRRMEETDDDYDPIRHSSIRVTDAQTLRVVKEEAGYVRFEVERQLARALRVHSGHRTSFSLPSGADGNVVSGNFYSAQPFGVIDGVDYMYTGFPRRVEVEKIRQVHESNDIVLLTPLGVSPSGEIFNVNSESLAASVAGSLAASKVIYFAVRGTALVKRDSNKIVQNLRLTDAKNLLQHYRVRIHKRGFASVDERGIEDSGEGGNDGGGDGDGDDFNPVRRARSSPAVTETLLKVGWATSALDKGVKRAHIIAPTNGALLQELYTRDGSGTLISRDLYEGIRPADVNDVAGIYDLIDPLVKMGTLVPRPRSVMEKDINSYYVYTRDNLIVATGQLKRFEGGYAEIGCLVVSRDYRSQGRGDAMLGYLERLCLQCGASKVFVLSTQTMEWFVERGFREVGVDELPPSRRDVYNYDRRSKIYMKKIDGDRDLDASELWWNR